MAPGGEKSTCHGQGQRLGMTCWAVGAITMSWRSSVFHLNPLLPSGSCTCREVQGQEQVHVWELLLGALPATSPLGTSIGQSDASEGDEPNEVSPTPMPGTREFTSQQWPGHGTNCPCKPNIPFLHTSAPSIILAVPPLTGKQPEK